MVPSRRKRLGRRSAIIGLVLGVTAVTKGSPWAADEQAISGPGGVPSIASSLPEYGDPWNHRRTLLDRGIQYNLIYTGEVLGNLAGGRRRGALYEGKLEIATSWDLGKLAGADGLTFFSNGFQIHRTAGISRDFVGARQTISAIEALPTTRLSELWLEQKLLDGTLTVRAGQLTADSEFFIASYSLPFINSDFPAISKLNLPGGGPAYPLSTPGIRVKWEPNPEFALLGAVFNGNPARPNTDPEISNRNGVNFRLRDPALLWTEMQFRSNQSDGAADLAQILRFGAWTHLGSFADQGRDRAGLLLTDPASDGTPARRRRNTSVYGIIDQQIYRPADGDANSGITVFSRISGTPSDRNLIDFYLDGGIVSSGMIPGRPADKLGATFLYSHFSADGRAADRLAAILGGTPAARRSYELALEFTYVAQIRPGWTLQPDLQFIIQPGGRVPEPGANPPRSATVLGLRTSIVY